VATAGASTEGASRRCSGPRCWVVGRVEVDREQRPVELTRAAAAGGHDQRGEDGQIRRTFLFDTLGDDTPGGVFVELLTGRFSGRFGGIDTCAALAEP
jgi:hypothetical protein